MLNDLTVFNLRKFISGIKDELNEAKLEEIFREFSCTKNLEVDRFLKEQSVEFTKKNQSVTYLVFSKTTASLLGYFSITIKPISISGALFSKRFIRKVARVSELDNNTGVYTLSAYLIAQLGKNYALDEEDRITGEQLLEAAVDTIKEIQYRAGGLVVFLETRENEKLLDFYETQNGYRRFDTRQTKGRQDKLVQLLKIL